MLNARVILGFMLSGLALGSVAAGGHREASEARAALVVDYSEILPVPGNASFEAADGDRGRNERLASCITRALRRGNVNVPLVTGAEFARIAFPEFAESEAAPHSAASLEVLVGNARFRERLTAAEIRYVVVVTGSNSVRETFHGTECWWIPYFLPICGKSHSWDSTIRVVATVYDLSQQLERAIPVFESRELGVLDLKVAANPARQSNAHWPGGCAEAGAAIAAQIRELESTRAAPKPAAGSLPEVSH